MLDCGFTVKATVYTADKSPTPIREFHSIICPVELPAYIILKLTRVMLHANGGDKMGGIADEEEDSSGVVKGYWSTPGASKGAENKPPVQGKWADKKKAPSTPLSGAISTPSPSPASGPGGAPGPSPAPVQGYWSRKDKPADVVSPLFDAEPEKKSDDGGPKKEVVKGYWARKEERKITSIWDDQ